MQKRVTEETPTRLGIRAKKDTFTLLFGVVTLLSGVGTFALGVIHLCFFGFGLFFTIIGIAMIYGSTVQYDWTFNKKDGTVIQTTLNMFRQSVVRQRYDLHDIQHAFIDEVEGDEGGTSYYPALKHISGETIHLMPSYYGRAKADKELVDRINAWMKSGGV